jgi:hypothetical protein
LACLTTFARILTDLSRSRSRKLWPACAAGRESRRGPLPPRETTGEYTAELAASPRLLRHLTRPRPVVRQTPRRRRSAPRPPGGIGLTAPAGQGRVASSARSPGAPEWTGVCNLENTIREKS